MRVCVLNVRCRVLRPFCWRYVLVALPGTNPISALIIDGSWKSLIMSHRCKYHNYKYHVNAAGYGSGN